jgi:hypothetical protein
MILSYSYPYLRILFNKVFSIKFQNMEQILWHNSKGIGKGFRFDMQWSEPIAVDDP